MKELKIGTIIGFLLLGLILFGMWGCPQYNVWEKALAGKAVKAS